MAVAALQVRVQVQVRVQHTPFTLGSGCRSRSRSRSRAIDANNPSPQVSFYGGLKLPAAVKIAAARRSKGGGGGARMMASAAESYASALADVAQSNGTLDATSADVGKIDEVFADGAVFDFFANPTVSLERKREVADEVCREAQLQPHAANFLNVLVDMNRTDLVREIAKEFEAAYNQLTETELAVVASVVKLESHHLAQIAKAVQRLTGAKNVRIKTTIDPSLVAGFTVRFGKGGSKLIDMSVKKQLHDIASQVDVGDIQLVT